MSKWVPDEWRCPHCGGSTWQDRCARPRCSVNSAKHMRRHGERLRYNLGSFKGKILMVTLTAPGVRGGCPWDPGLCTRKGPHTHSGENGCKVEQLAADVWNDAMWDSWQKLHRKARERASRKVPGVGSRLLSKSPEYQKRGVFHLHILYGAATAREIHWTAVYVHALKSLATAEGFGEQIEVGHWSPAAGAGGYVAKYVSKAKGVKQAWEQGTLPARAFYVNPKLTSRTGVTIRMLKRKGTLWFEGLDVRLPALAALSKLEAMIDEPVPAWLVEKLDGVTVRGPPVA